MLAFEGAKDKLVDMGYPEEAICGVPRYSSRHRRDSCPSHHEVGGLFLDFEAVRTEAMLRAGDPYLQIRPVTTHAWTSYR